MCSLMYVYFIYSIFSDVILNIKMIHLHLKYGHEILEYPLISGIYFRNIFDLYKIT